MENSTEVVAGEALENGIRTRKIKKEKARRMKGERTEEETEKVDGEPKKVNLISKKLV